MARPKKVRKPPQVNGFVISFALPGATSLGQARTAVLSVKRHIGALCAALGGPDIAEAADVTFSAAKGTFLIGAPPPDGFSGAYRRIFAQPKRCVIVPVKGKGSGPAKLRAEERARRPRGKGIVTKAKRT